MKVELNIEANQMGDTLVDMFKNLSDDQKRDVATSVLKGWLEQPASVEAGAADAAAIAEVRKESYYASHSDARIRETPTYHNAYAKQPNSRIKMVQEIVSQVVAYQKDYITKHIQDDPQIQAQLAETLATVKENFPKFVHDAMVGYFAAQMNAVMSGVQTALVQSDQARNISETVSQKVLRGY